MKSEEMFTIPELPELRRLSGIYLVKHVFQSHGPTNLSVYKLAVHFVHQTDRAVVAYENARKSLLDIANRTPDSLPIGKALEASTQFEHCAASIHRALVYAKTLHRHKFKPIGLGNCFPQKPQLIWESAEATLFRNLRNIIQHLEKELTEGKLTEIMIFPDTTGIRLGKIKITYENLMTYIVRLHGIAANVSKFSETELGPR